jgi:hypothetical protein
MRVRHSEAGLLARVFNEHVLLASRTAPVCSLAKSIKVPVILLASRTVEQPQTSQHKVGLVRTCWPNLLGPWRYLPKKTQSKQLTVS